MKENAETEYASYHQQDGVTVSQCHSVTVLLINVLFEVHYRISNGLFFFCREYFASKYKQEML